MRRKDCPASHPSPAAPGWGRRLAVALAAGVVAALWLAPGSALAASGRTAAASARAAVAADPEGQDLAGLLVARKRLDPARVGRRVMVFYYPWYGTADGPGGRGRTLHWGRIDPAAKDIQASTHYPALGAYDSHDPAVIDRHVTWAKEAGIDTLILSWWGHGQYTDRAVPLILAACRRHGLSATLYYETCPRTRTPEATARDLARALEKYGRDPAFLKVEGRPVLFIYGRAVGQLGSVGWLQAAALLDRLVDPDPILIGDAFSYPAARVFDGLHTYNTAGHLRQKPVEAVRAWARETYPRWVALADGAGRISTLTVIPGYDDTKIRTPGLAVPRHEGRSYRVQWEEAIRADPHWVLVTSFNEWHEGSEIEPSAEFGRAYLDLTAKMARRFKARPRAPHPAALPAGLSAEDLARLRQRLAGRTVGVLPGADSVAFWFLLADLRAPLQLLAWADVAEGRVMPARFPLLLYAGGEAYRTTVRAEGDVTRGLEGYLRAGGFLLVFPTGPWPFYYDEADERVVKHSGRFGLSIRSGWEAPRDGGRLRLVQAGRRLAHLPAETPFPKAGDRRWRPMVPADHRRYVPLVSLRDEAGRSLGEAAAYAEPKTGGRVLYAWFGLLRGPRAPAVVLDLLEAALEEAEGSPSARPRQSPRESRTGTRKSTQERPPR